VFKDRLLAINTSRDYY